MLPFYIYYSMFGFQRVGDQIWAAADQRPRGFLLGATSGRTTLGGEGLQHQDGSSHLIAATIPNCKAWDPAFSAEMAVIVDRGMREMMVEQKDVFYYITLMNENYAQLDLPEGAEEDLLRGAYRLMQLRPAASAGAKSAKSGKTANTSGSQALTMLGSGAILTEVIKAAHALVEQGIAVDVISVTSWSQLARDGQACEVDETPPFLTRLLEQTEGPIVAATDYVRAVPESVRAYLPMGRAYSTLGTDGFGRSDTRSALRGFFGVDAASIQAAAQRALKP
jgi:pyruvate dehydrogenase E1 component